MAFTLNAGPASTTPASTTGSVQVVLNSVSAGDLIVVGVVASSNTSDVSSINISGESDATLLTEQLGPGSSSEAVIGYLLEVTTGGNKTITANFSNANSRFKGIWAASFTPSAGTAVFDAEATDFHTGTTPSVSLTTLNDNALVIGHFSTGAPSSETAGSGYTLVTLTDNAMGWGAEYDLDGGTAGARNVDWSLGSGQNVAITSASFYEFTPTTGEVTFELMLLEGTDGTGSGAVSMQQMTAEGFGGADGVAVFEQMTALGFDYDALGFVDFEQMTAQGYGGAEGAAIFSAMTAYGYDENVSTGVVVFEALIPAGTGTYSPHGVVSFEQLTVDGFMVPSADGPGAVEFEELTATGALLSEGTAAGAVEFELLDAEAFDGYVGSTSFEAMAAAGETPNAGSGAVTFEQMYAMQTAGQAEFQRLVAAGAATSSIPEVYAPKVVNLRTGAVSEYSNHNYNSFARIGRDYYAAGPSGLIKLSGATDLGANINWVVKTGQMDDKDPGLKRLPEVLLGLRSNNKITVRVHPSDVTSYDYTLPAVNIDRLHQHRVRPGKGMRSRYYAVELRGQLNATLELDSMQVNMTKTTRRLG